jgi:sporulation protein YlmC with PRC-barrel domain
MESHTREEVADLLGREVVDMNGSSVGYVDLVFVDHDTSRPEWLGVWSGTPGGPRVLVPLRGAEVSTGEIRVPWTESVVRDAPDYGEEDDRGLVSHDTGGIAISSEKERAAYLHYGLEPPESREGMIRSVGVTRG